MDYDLSKLSNYTKIGLMGGTFNPVHFGHLAVAEAARDKYDLDLVLFVPTGAPPHKDTTVLAPARHRFAMLRLAIKSNRRFGATMLECARDGITYSVDTIKEIRSHMRPGSELFFIIGSDTAAVVRTWKDYEVIERLTAFIVLPRPGTDTTLGLPDNAALLDMPMLDISSANIRERIHSGESIRYLLPENVIKYIADNNLYQVCKHTIPQIVKYVERTQTAKRYSHTMSVYEAAARLSIQYSADEKKTAVAALLHDCAKDFTAKEKARLCVKYGIKRTGILKDDIELAHPLIGAKLAADRFQIQDKEILDAVKYHTTGRKNMGLTEKIVFVADLISADRPNTPEVAEIRRLSVVDIDKALLIGLKLKIAYTREKGLPIHPLSLEAVEYYEKKG